jgi:hypothetical protein
MATKPKTETVSAKQETASVEYSTQDYNAIRLAAGKLTEEGVTFIPAEMTEGEGRFGVYWLVKGVNAEDKPVELMLSSEKLHKVLEANWDALVGKSINIRGVGDSFSREYFVRLG